MANPTTNFGWVMPNSADLVTDLPADFNIFGQGVDTSMVGLLGGTTGQVLSKTSGTNMAFTWVTTDDANAIQNSIMDAKGDLIGATADNTPARLAVGTNNQVLTADSAQATGIKWATPASGGGMTLLETLSLSGTVTSVTSSTIASTYKNLYILFVSISCGSGNLDATIRFNSDSGTNYGYSGVSGQDTSAAGATTAAATSIPFVTVSTNNSFNGSGFMQINRYTDTTRRVISTHQFGSISGGSNKRYNAYGACYYDGSSAISTLTFARVQTDQTFNAGNIYIYGVS